jgi:hypothetical protein
MKKGGSLGSVVHNMEESRRAKGSTIEVEEVRSRDMRVLLGDVFRVQHTNTVKGYS